MRYFMVNYVQRMVRRGQEMRPEMDEVISVSKKIRLRDHQYMKVILDFKTKQVVQASMDGVTIPKDFSKIRDYYHQHYAKVIEDLEAQWNPRDLEDAATATDKDQESQ